MSDSAIRLSIFCGALIALGIAEIYIPRRDFPQLKMHRWFTNLSLAGLDNITLRIVFPILAVGVAEYVNTNGFGAFGLLGWPVWLELILSVILLDLAIYLQHVATHKIPFLWAVHQVHHADTEVDVTTGIRFHPIEIILSMLYKFAIIWVLGASGAAVFIFEVLLNVFAMFSHANIKLPASVDGILRRFIVTPDMHRIHHSITRREADSNYGFNLSIWDHLFGTYTHAPKTGQLRMHIGIKPSYQTAKPSYLAWCLMLPLKAYKNMFGSSKN